jgi:hypothetical protein
MSTFFYLITEGILDAIFFGKLLKEKYKATLISDPEILKITEYNDKLDRVIKNLKEVEGKVKQLISDFKDFTEMQGKIDELIKGLTEMECEAKPIKKFQSNVKKLIRKLKDLKDLKDLKEVENNVEDLISKFENLKKEMQENSQFINLFKELNHLKPALKSTPPRHTSLMFCQLKEGKVIVLRSAGGVDGIPMQLATDMEIFKRASGASFGPISIGIIVDADEQLPAERYDKLKKKLKEASALEKFNFPEAEGLFSPDQPRVGAFFCPGPGKKGTLEELLLDLGKAAYPALATAAKQYVDEFCLAQQTKCSPNKNKWKKLNKPAGEKKATISAMTALLQPASASHLSIRDDDWITEKTLSPALTDCLAFINDLLQSHPN